MTGWGEVTAWTEKGLRQGLDKVAHAVHIRNHFVKSTCIIFSVDLKLRSLHVNCTAKQRSCVSEVTQRLSNVHQAYVNDLLLGQQSGHRMQGKSLLQILQDQKDSGMQLW